MRGYWINLSNRASYRLRLAATIPLYTCALGIISGELLGLAGLPMVVMISSALILVLAKPQLVYLLILVLAGYCHSHGFQQELVELRSREVEKLLVEVAFEPTRSEYSQLLLVSGDGMAGLVQLKLPKYPVYKVGEQLTISGKLEVVEDQGGYSRYLLGRKVYQQVNYPQVEYVGRVANLHSLSADIREIILSRVRANFLEPESSLFAGLVIGSTRFSPQLESSMQLTGVTHLVAVSGSNVGIVLVAIMALGRHMARRKVLLLAGVSVVLYGFVVGTNNIPAIRAVIMALIWLTGKFLGRRNSVFAAFVTTISLLVLDNPLIFYDVSFLLSVTAFAGILALYEPLRALFAKFKLAGEVLAGTIAAGFGANIVSAVSFGGMSLIGILANLILIPVMSLLSILAYSVTVLLLIVQDIGWLSSVIAVPYELSLRLIQLLGEIPGIYADSPWVVITTFTIQLIILIYADYRIYRQPKLGYAS